MIGDVRTYFDVFEAYLDAIEVADTAQFAGRPGVAALRERENRLSAELDVITARIDRMPARTIAGVLARLEQAFTRPELEELRAGAPFDEDRFDDVPARVGYALWQDLTRLAAT